MPLVSKYLLTEAQFSCLQNGGVFMLQDCNEAQLKFWMFSRYDECCISPGRLIALIKIYNKIFKVCYLKQ